jgi:hypothetical protein
MARAAVRKDGGLKEFLQRASRLRFPGPNLSEPWNRQIVQSDVLEARRSAGE